MLIVSNNSIGSLHDLSIIIPSHQIDCLIEIDLSSNGIDHLGRGHVFYNQSHLRVLDLSHNKFRTLFAGVFRGLKRLEFLIMNNGHLKYIDEHGFDGLEMLKHLDLSSNQISSVYLELFQSISNLHVSLSIFFHFKCSFTWPFYAFMPFLLLSGFLAL